jgi:hypothetical protein
MEAVIPTRLIEVGLSDEDVRLYIPNNQKVQYAALSHCWGGNISLQTTTATLERHMKQIILGKSSQTSKDAIRVTRELGIKYIWIDSLCIIQDDNKDWELEASRMNQVYRNASITLSADAASNPFEGLFVPADRRQKAYVEYQNDCPTLDGSNNDKIHV